MEMNRAQVMRNAVVIAPHNVINQFSMTNQEDAQRHTGTEDFSTGDGTAVSHSVMMTMTAVVLGSAAVLDAFVDVFLPAR